MSDFPDPDQMKSVDTEDEKDQTETLAMVMKAITEAAEKQKAKAVKITYHSRLAKDAFTPGHIEQETSSFEQGGVAEINIRFEPNWDK